MSSTHPFLVDQRAYLPRASSSASIHSTSSASSASSCSSTYTYNTILATPSTFAGTFTTTFTSAEAHRTTGEHTPVDTDCLRFMSTTSDSEYIFGSVPSRGTFLSREERSLRREVEVDMVERVEAEGSKDEGRRKKRFGRLF